MRTLSKFASTAALALATTLVLSCSDDGGDDSSSRGANGSFIVTGTYGRATTEDALVAIDDWYSYRDIDFEKKIYLLEEYEDEDCLEDGTLEIEKETYVDEVEYSINNKVLSLDWGYSEDSPIKFNGSSNALEGTWIRNVNKAASCRERTYEECYGSEHYDYENDEWVCEGEAETYTYLSCDEGYDMTKAVFTPTKATFTREVCPAEREDGRIYKGWTYKAIDCGSYEMLKGSEKVKIKYNISANKEEFAFTYNGKSCTLSITELSVSQKKQACKDAANKYKAEGGYLDDYYWDYRYAYRGYDKFEKCLKDNNFPRELQSDGEDGYEGSIAMLKKAKAPQSKKSKRSALPLR